ncbi:TetR/AcrR family transcriptional regulator [Kineococcus radiotolerans]|uniref:Transcriptional regulator, TetR family n=1 Tax=Kineococcus radiotolerans (strain ATCC BAA-149 / DSM 14245 / SRS30216) TaxID=266940 RepID=A6WFA3_KINRD|nr:TetR/AcrR family transcriptional regulator [Kineococcus radiotolerans]ABS05492.1 transcriptional regulator, TetR family [Kineococcus radiotolerans SRS30216 = ATCC BAA-149]
MDGQPKEPRDGRRTRWDEHRRRRREELVTAALRAITAKGAGVGMDEVAAAAGTSKTVLYRHFADKEELYLAVADRVNSRILRELGEAVAASANPRQALSGIIAAYVQLVEADPEVYRFVVSHPFLERPLTSDPVQRISATVADETARTITAHLRVGGARDSSADALAHGLVALIRTAADRWISSPDRVPAATLVSDLTHLAWGGLSTVLAPVPEEVP